MSTSARRRVLVQDEIEATKADVWWFMHTQADVILQDGGRMRDAIARRQELEARIESPESARFEVRPAEPLPTSPNPAGQKSNSGSRKLSILSCRRQHAAKRRFSSTGRREPGFSAEDTPT